MSINLIYVVSDRLKRLYEIMRILVYNVLLRLPMTMTECSMCRDVDRIKIATNLQMHDNVFTSTVFGKMMSNKIQYDCERRSCKHNVKTSTLFLSGRSIATLNTVNQNIDVCFKPLGKKIVEIVPVRDHAQSPKR